MSPKPGLRDLSHTPRWGAERSAASRVEVQAAMHLLLDIEQDASPCFSCKSWQTPLTTNSIVHPVPNRLTRLCAPHSCHRLVLPSCLLRKCIPLRSTLQSDLVPAVAVLVAREKYGTGMYRCQDGRLQSQKSKGGWSGCCQIRACRVPYSFWRWFVATAWRRKMRSNGGWLETESLLGQS